MQPIGQLVEPIPDETELLSAPQDAVVRADRQPPDARRVGPALEEVLAALGVVLLGFVVIARRRRLA